jgi:hypothetical protein
MTTAGCPGAGDGVGVTSGVTSGMTPTPSGNGVGQICGNANQCSVYPWLRLAFITLPKYELGYFLTRSCMNSHAVCWSLGV